MIRFEGYATRWGVHHGHPPKVIMQGAFAAALDAFRAAGRMPPMLFMHDRRTVVGAWTDIEEDETGLKVSGNLAAGIDPARLGFVGGRLPALSCKTAAVKRDAEIRTGHDGKMFAILTRNAELLDISIVDQGGCPGARVTSVKVMELN